MFIYNPKELYRVWSAFYAFVDFLIKLINEDKVEVKRKPLYCSSGNPFDFDIWLVDSKNLDDQLDISFAYEDWKGMFVGGTVTPIERFRFTMIKALIVLFDVESREPKDYDKMLELFRACLSSVGRHYPNWHKEILSKIDLDSLERKSWQKSKKDIERELDNSLDLRMATQDFDRKREQMLSNLASKYSGQGYEITE